MKISIETIPHSEQRYDTPGDWWISPNGVIQIRVSDINNDKYHLLLALHELIEQQLCHDRGITDDVVSLFDISFEGKGEPGDNRYAPYHKEHRFATKIERLMAKQLKINWKKYDQRVNKL